MNTKETVIDMINKMPEKHIADFLKKVRDGDIQNKLKKQGKLSTTDLSVINALCQISVD